MSSLTLSTVPFTWRSGVIISTNPVILRGYERDAERLEAQARQLRQQATLGWEAIVMADKPELERPSIDTSEWGWDCEESPTGKCVYDWATNDECCVYCGDPEERK